MSAIEFCASLLCKWISNTITSQSNYASVGSLSSKAQFAFGNPGISLVARELAGLSFGALRRSLKVLHQPWESHSIKSCFIKWVRGQVQSQRGHTDIWLLAVWFMAGRKGIQRDQVLHEAPNHASPASHISDRRSGALWLVTGDSWWRVLATYFINTVIAAFFSRSPGEFPSTQCLWTFSREKREQELSSPLVLKFQSFSFKSSNMSDISPLFLWGREVWVGLLCISKVSLEL